MRSIFQSALQLIDRIHLHGFLSFSRIASLISISLFGLLGLLDIAKAQAVTPLDTTQQTMEALARANAAVVGIKVTAIEDAKSIETLGEQRHGSGVIISPDGLILTIGYLMLEAEQIEIVTQDNGTVPARAVAYDLATGFGLIRPLLPLQNISAAPLGSVHDLQAGDPLLAMTGPQAHTDGNGDVEISMTRLVSKRAFSGTWEYHLDTALFTSPPVMVGGGNHSGAPLFNQKGELLGIGSLVVPDATGESRRVPGNMFVPIDLLLPILAELQQSGSSTKSHRPWLGLTSNTQNGHVQVLRVSKDSPAELAGLEVGDILLEIDGTKISTLEEFYTKLWEHGAPDAEIKLTIQKRNDVKTIELKAEDRMLTLKKPSSI